MELSGYSSQLSAVAKQRYMEKVTAVGLAKDPYCIEDHFEWEKSPELLPSIAWSDVILFMVATPSPYTGEAIEVHQPEYEHINGY